MTDYVEPLTDLLEMWWTGMAAAGVRRSPREHCRSMAELIVGAGWTPPEDHRNGVAKLNRALGVNLWDAPSFRADVRIDFDERGRVMATTLLNPKPGEVG